MKVLILAGGLGTRLAEETEVRPKPMVEIGGRPILWHILKHFSHHGFNEFYVALGYRGDYIKRYFLDYAALSGDLRVTTGRQSTTVLESIVEDWDLHLIDTGVATNTGGRLLRMRQFLEDAPFIVTYGDGVADIDLKALVAFHGSHDLLATVTAVRPPARFGGLEIQGHQVVNFSEKPQAGEGWINGGFLVFEPEIFNHITRGDEHSLEAETLEKLASAGQLGAYQHYGFWQCMDTLRDKRILDDFWQRGAPPWKTWS